MFLYKKKIENNRSVISSGYSNGYFYWHLKKNIFEKKHFENNRRLFRPVIPTVIFTDIWRKTFLKKKHFENNRRLFWPVISTVIFIFIMIHFHFRLPKMSHRVDIDSKSTVDYPKS